MTESEERDALIRRRFPDLTPRELKVLRERLPASPGDWDEWIENGYLRSRERLRALERKLRDRE